MGTPSWSNRGFIEGKTLLPSPCFALPRKNLMAKRIKPPKEATMDTAAREYIRERDSDSDCPEGYGRCQHCNRILDFSQLQCSHLLGRRHREVRFDPENLVLLCMVAGKYKIGCHTHLDRHPIELHLWAQEFLGEDRYALLQERGRKLCKRTKQEKWDIVDTLRDMKDAL